MKIRINDLEKFYLRASLVGYASGAPALSLTLPGAKGFFYQEKTEELSLAYYDVFWDLGEGKFFGFILLTVDGQLAWTMRYQGEGKPGYAGKPKITDTLKKALAAAYEKGLFLGGRGERIFVDGRLGYGNNTGDRESFSKFSGREYVRDCCAHRWEEEIYSCSFDGGLVLK